MVYVKISIVIRGVIPRGNETELMSIVTGNFSAKIHSETSYYYVIAVIKNSYLN